MGKVAFVFRIDIGLDEDRGYGATVTDVQLGRMKGIKGNSMEQLMSRIRNVVLEEMRRKRNFPLESERARIITPGSGDPLFKQT